MQKCPFKKARNRFTHSVHRAPPDVSTTRTAHVHMSRCTRGRVRSKLYFEHSPSVWFTWHWMIPNWPGPTGASFRTWPDSVWIIPNVHVRFVLRSTHVVTRRTVVSVLPTTTHRVDNIDDRGIVYDANRTFRTSFQHPEEPLLQYTIIFRLPVTAV